MKEISYYFSKAPDGLTNWQLLQVLLGRLGLGIEKFLMVVGHCFKQYKPKIYLSEGQYGGPITTRAIQKFFNDAKQKAGVKQKVGIHSLRHSFATHLHESGIDIKYIGDLLGHKDIKTTSIYTHVSKREIGKVRSPLDE